MAKKEIKILQGVNIRTMKKDIKSLKSVGFFKKNNVKEINPTTIKKEVVNPPKVTEQKPMVDPTVKVVAEKPTIVQNNFKEKTKNETWPVKKEEISKVPIINDFKKPLEEKVKPVEKIDDKGSVEKPSFTAAGTREEKKRTFMEDIENWAKSAKEE